MKHTDQRNIKIIDELMSFSSKLGANKYQIEVEKIDKETEIKFKAYIKHMDDKMLSSISKLLSTPRSHEMEEYYWNLQGEGDIDSELALVGMMTDDAKIDYVEGEYLEIELKRH